MGKIYSINIDKFKNNQMIQDLMSNKELFFDLSDEKKYDYETLNSIFILFEYDLVFLKRVYEDIEKNVDEYWVIEFSLRMIKLLEQKNENVVNIKKYIPNASNSILDTDGELTLFTIKLFLLAKTDEISNKISTFVNLEKNSNYGLGFVVIEDQFYFSEIIMNYFADRFITQIFLKLNIEKFLHESYESYDAFKSVNPELNLFITEFISLRDIALGSYIKIHPELLQELHYVFHYIEQHWNSYIDFERNAILEDLAGEIFDYASKNKGKYETPETLRNMIYYAFYNNGILDEIFIYIYGADKEYLEIIRKMCVEFKESKSSIEDTVDYLYFNKIIKESLNRITDYGFRAERKKKNLTV